MMRRCGSIVSSLALGCFVWVVFIAQAPGQQSAANLRGQLAEAQAKETELKTRLQQLAEDLEPQSIERSLAGIGSTHPEELRAQRQRQLQIEQKGLQAQLDTLTASRARLEAAIASADAITYQSAGTSQSAGSPGGVQPQTINSPAISSSQAISSSPARAKHRTRRRLHKRRSK